MALRAACGRLKKLKMLTVLKTVLSPELLQMLHEEQRLMDQHLNPTL